MEWQPILNGKSKPLLYCISSFKKVLLWKVPRYSHQFFYLLFYNFLELLLTLSEKDLCLKFYFFNRFTKTQTPLWPKPSTLLCLILRGGGVNQMHQGGNYQCSWGFFSQSLQFDSPDSVYSPSFCEGRGEVLSLLPSFRKGKGAWQDLNF